jgi:Zn-finger protein
MTAHVDKHEAARDESNSGPALETHNFQQFTHHKCEFFPCHEGVPVEIYNCLFCFCPLYLLKEQCGGHFKYLENGIKDCSGCTIPHGADSYERIMSKMTLVISGARKEAK